jgi:hypothetical protein
MFLVWFSGMKFLLKAAAVNVRNFKPTTLGS